jgi:hypothetical protein
MQRVVKGIPAKLTLPVEYPVTSGTVSITRDRDSASVVNSATVNVDAAAVSYTLAGQPDEANLTATWSLTTSAGAMTISEPVQVVAFASVSLAELRLRRPLDDVTRYPDALLLRARAQLEDQLAERAGVSFVGGEFSVVVDAPDKRELFLPVARVRKLTAVNINKQDLTQAEIDEIIVDERQGSLYRRWGWHYFGYDSWFNQRLNVKITGLAGFSQPLGGLSFAMAKGIRYMLVDSPTNDRQISVSNEAGMTENLMVAGLRNAIFAIPELNMLVEQARSTFGVA